MIVSQSHTPEEIQETVHHFQTMDASGYGKDIP